MGTLGDRIRRQREACGLTMEELANKVGVQASAINKYEKGIVENIKKANVEALAFALNCSPAWLMFGEDRVDVSLSEPELKLIGSIRRDSALKSFYTDDGTKSVAQELFENEDLRLLFDAAKDASPEDLKTVHTMLLALKKKEEG